MKRDGFAALVVIVILFALIGAIIYFHFAYPTKPLAQNNISTSTVGGTVPPEPVTPIVSTSSTGVPQTNPAPLLNTSTWQTFKDQWLSFMFPAGWTIADQKDTNPNDYFYVSLGQATSNWLSLESNPFYPPPQITSLESGTAFIEGQLSSSTIHAQEIPVGNGEAFYFVNPGGMNESRGPEAFLASNNSIYDLSYFESSLPPQDQQSVFLTLLSTLQFTSSSHQ